MPHSVQALMCLMPKQHPLDNTNDIVFHFNKFKLKWQGRLSKMLVCLSVFLENLGRRSTMYSSMAINDDEKKPYTEKQIFGYLLCATSVCVRVTREPYHCIISNYVFRFLLEFVNQGTCQCVMGYNMVMQ